MRYNLKTVRKAIIKKPTNNKSWQGYAEKGALVYCWQDCKLVRPLWKTGWSILKKTKHNKTERLYDPAVPHLNNIQRK